MNLNSLDFFLFFILFFFGYWQVFNRNLKVQNLFLLAGCYVFYAWWDWRFLLILIVSTIFNFFLGKAISNSLETKRRRFFVLLGIFQGIGVLLYFKYFNFFINSFIDAFAFFQIDLSIHTLKIILPLGISYYTFRSISYILDIDKGKIKATNDLVIFSTYLSFFPSILSGPIDKAKTFIPQMEKKRNFELIDAKEGLRQILWGLFKKVVIADNCGMIVNQLFDNFQSFPASSLILGAFLYTIQIYADFSGYTDMAIGISRLIGFKIPKNFDFPFFTQSIPEFWHKWHMSLTSWLTEYVYTPLSIYFRDYGKAGAILAILINFTIVGMWHGASWNCILFGFIHGCYFIPIILKGKLNKKKRNTNYTLFPSLGEFFNMAGIFSLVMFTFITFRTTTILEAFYYYKQIFSNSLFAFPKLPSNSSKLVIPFILVMVIVEWLQRKKEYVLQIDNIENSFIKWSIYYCLIFIIILLGTTSENQFIYFKF